VWCVVPLRPRFDRMADCDRWSTQAASWLEWGGSEIGKRPLPIWGCDPQKAFAGLRPFVPGFFIEIHLKT
jgi:hypothetical protein